MKVIKDSFNKWLDEEIAKIEKGIETEFPSDTVSSRLQTLKEVKTKLQETIIEEFSKLKKE